MRRLVLLLLGCASLAAAADKTDLVGTFTPTAISNTNTDGGNRLIVSRQATALQIVCPVTSTTGTISLMQSIDGGAQFLALTGTGCAAITATAQSPFNCAITNPIGIYKVTTTGCTGCGVAANTCVWAMSIRGEK